MNTTIRLSCLSLVTIVLAGCAADASPGLPSHSEELVAVARAADSAPYLQTFDPDFQAIIFQPGSPIDSVILHVTIDGTRTTNVPMPETGTSAAAGPSYEIASLPVLPGDAVVYSFTYAANGVAHDTQPFSYTLPTSWAPTTFFTEASADAITVMSTAALAWADVHYTVNSGTAQNVRLGQQGSRYVQPIALGPGDVLRYSVTYATDAGVFETAPASYVDSSNLLAGPWRFVRSDVTPATAYTINGDAIGLDFQGYFSWNGTWASGYEGYTFEQPAAIVQGGNYVLTVDVTNANVPVPAVVKASISGAGAEQEQQSFGNGVLTFTFAVSSDPGSAPVVDLVAHPVLGQIGPVQGTGIGVQTYELTASLVRQ